MQAAPPDWAFGPFFQVDLAAPGEAAEVTCDLVQLAICCKGFHRRLRLAVVAWRREIEIFKLRQLSTLRPRQRGQIDSIEWLEGEARRRGAIRFPMLQFRLRPADEI
ncbi:hypothetical protein AK812_SmicGene45703 [Symbiodinium microadriaticum]|uniref:Uncharacterized protein n=1 Tax=Symbiodinium microadriaticum TaxID=2951 RepID=A0A1Q9BVS3_SYMMI|nr:hypothetical protein AK812_SmicGene45703 [Symbiodinium microadriaticum]